MFPQNYIDHIKSKIGSVDIIFVSSHKEVRDALVDNGISFTLVYPEIGLKDEYVRRYIKRGSGDGFINLVENNWDAWINELKTQVECDHIVLVEGQHLIDCI